MPEVTSHPISAFCWFEIATSDVAGAQSFYGALFGWSFFEVPMGGEHGGYTLVQVKGKDIGGLYGLMPEQKAGGVPPHWLPYVNVANVDGSTDKAQSLGGKLVFGPMDVMDHGRMSVLADPAGAAFAVWQAKSHIGTVVIGEHGTPCWAELATNDTAKAGAFYSALFGWKPNNESMGDAYTMFQNGERFEGGMMAITPEMGPVPPNWSVYIQVDNDADELAKKVATLGGRVLHGPADVPNVGRFVIGMDPQGACFAFIKMLPKS